MTSDEGQSGDTLAETMLVFMVKGLFSRLQFPYAHFPAANLTGADMVDPFWEAVDRLEVIGFKVCAVKSITM